MYILLLEKYNTIYLVFLTLIIDNVDCSFQKGEIIILAKHFYPYICESTLLGKYMAEHDSEALAKVIS